VGIRFSVLVFILPVIGWVRRLTGVLALKLRERQSVQQTEGPSPFLARARCLARGRRSRAKDLHIGIARIRLSVRFAKFDQGLPAG
jgi:hypothetical protein